MKATAQRNEMTTEQIKSLFSNYGVEVKRVTNRLGKKIVTIDWKDYLKVRETEITQNETISLKF
jgi:hypothetical protein